ncbi:unannotated protein [freshwater metagenome]|uniref:Unannotated protein n=1 Tax=freshwater metagenome TaxID=449393 RepID=A0A6J6ZDW7_9ZZZZ
MSTAPSTAMPTSARGAGSRPTVAHVCRMASASASAPPCRSTSDNARGIFVAMLSGSSGSTSPRSAAVVRVAERSPSAATRMHCGDAVSLVSATHWAVGPSVVVRAAVQMCGTVASVGNTAISACAEVSANSLRSGEVRTASSAGSSVTTTSWPRWPSHSASTVARPVSSITALLSSGSVRCGRSRRLAHAVGWAVTITMRTSAGPHDVANCISSERATPRACGPRTANRLPARRSTAMAIPATGGWLCVARSSGSGQATSPRPSAANVASPWSRRRAHSRSPRW